MNPLLTLEHVGFAYHQAEGETPALSDICLLYTSDAADE